MEEEGLAIITPLVRTIDLGLVDVLPAVCSAQHVLDFLALHPLALVVALVEDHLVGACLAFKAVETGELLLFEWQVVCWYGRYCEAVAAGWADCGVVLVEMTLRVS